MSSIDSASSKWDAYKGTAKRELGIHTTLSTSWNDQFSLYSLWSTADAARETLLTSAEIADKEYLQPATQILVSFSKTKPLLLAFIIILALFSLVPISLFFIFSATSVATLLFGALALAMILIGSASAWNHSPPPHPRHRWQMVIRSCSRIHPGIYDGGSNDCRVLDVVRLFDLSILQYSSWCGFTLDWNKRESHFVVPRSSPDSAVRTRLLLENWKDCSYPTKSVRAMPSSRPQITLAQKWR